MTYIAIFSLITEKTLHCTVISLDKQCILCN